MDERLRVTAVPRDVPDSAGNLPLVTIGWRALKAAHMRRSDELRQRDQESRKAEALLADLAEGIHGLRTAVEALAPGQGNAEAAPKWPVLFGRLERLLADAGVEVLVPAGQPYDGDLMDLFENVAQRPTAGLQGPRIDEVLVPAILYRGAPVRIGKAVIAVPEIRIE